MKENNPIAFASTLMVMMINVFCLSLADATSLLQSCSESTL